MKTQKIRSFAIISALAGALLSGFAHAALTEAWENNSVSGFRNDSWSFGEIFTVGNSNITVSALGALDVGRDGFVSRGGIKVGLFLESTGALLTSGNVLSGDLLQGNYRFADIADIVLSANTQYRVVAVNGDDLYNIAGGPADYVDASITWNGYGYCATTSLTSCDDWSGTDNNWMANMLIGESGNGVPEPASIALLGLGLAGLGFGRRRKA